MTPAQPGATTGSRAERLRDAARAYARAGWPVFPVRPDDPGCAAPDSCACKAPLTRHGLDDATTDPQMVERFWARHPDANIAIATGGPAPVVLDVDVTHGRPGYRSLNQAIRAGLVPPPMAAVRTPSGGLHLYYCATPGQRNGSLPSHGLDWRAERGYVLAPPSRVHGRPYAWAFRDREPATIDFTRLRLQFQPEARRGTRPRLAGRHDSSALVNWVARLQPGNRNAGLWWAAWRAAQAGDDTAIGQIARAALGTGLSQREVDRTIASAVRTAARPHEPGQREAG